MRLLFSLSFISITLHLWAGVSSYTVFWRLDLHKESEKNKYSFSEISEYIYNITQGKKTVFYSDSTCKNKLKKETFTQYLFEKNQSVAGYTWLNVQEEWKFSAEGVVSKVTFLSFENPSLNEKETYRKLYVPAKYISTLLNEISISGYYNGRANIPLSEWIKKHDFDYTVLKTAPELPKPPYSFQYNKVIDDTTYKRIQLLFDFFPENNKVFDRTYKRDKATLEELSYLHTYSNEAQSNLFRNVLLESLEKNKLLKSNSDIEEILQNNTANFVFYFEGITTSKGLEWTDIRVYVTSGIHSTLPQYLCVDVSSKSKIKTVDDYLKKKSGYTLEEYFRKVKVDFLVSYINNSFAKDAEEGLILRHYFFGF